MIYLTNTGRSQTQQYINYAKAGLKNAVSLDPLEIIKKQSCEKIIIFGILRGCNLVYKWAEQNKIDFYYMDRPYWGETRNHPFYLKVVKNNHLKSFIDHRPDDRFKKTFPWNIEPWKKNGREIVVCPPSNAISEFFGVNNWLEKTLTTLKANTDRPIIIKTKGYNPIVGYDNNGQLIVTGKDNNPPQGKINWNTVHAIVTYNSNITLEATARGIPCFTDTHNACAPISETDFSKIETPKYVDREPCYYSLAYGQFTAEELSNGYTWRILDEQ